MKFAVYQDFELARDYDENSKVFEILVMGNEIDYKRK